jgi:hypothetical protein
VVGGRYKGIFNVKEMSIFVDVSCYFFKVPPAAVLADRQTNSKKIQT